MAETRNTNTSKAVCDPQVRLLQLRLNSIRDKYHQNWEKLNPDGIYGPRTKNVVIAFQKMRGITPASGILGPTTIKYIVEADTPKTLPSYSDLDKYYDNIKKGTVKTYEITSRTVGATYQLDSIVNPNEKRFATIFSEWGKVIDHQYEGLMRRISKFPAKKQMRARNITKQLDACKKFVEKAKKYGINTAAVQLGNNLTKENAIKYIKEIGEVISNSSLTKGIRALTRTFEKIKNVISPVIKFLNDIPGLKYLSVIEKIVKATIKMLQCDFEGAFKLYLDALRELIEQIVVDAVVVAAIAAGGWIALVIALVVIIGSMLLDYFFFSDNPGQSVADKHLNLKTQNVLQDNVAPWAYHLVND